MLAVERLVEDDLARARPVVLAERDVARVLGLDQRGLRRVARGGGTVVGELDVRRGGKRVLRVAGHVEAVGLAREGALASVGDLERPAVARRLEVAADEDERDFHVARAVLVGRARRELDDAELRQLHLVLAHVEDLVVALLRFAADEKIVAHFQIFLSGCILLQSPPSPQAKQPNMLYPEFPVANLKNSVQAQTRLRSSSTDFIICLCHMECSSSASVWVRRGGFRGNRTPVRGRPPGLVFAPRRRWTSGGGRESFVRRPSA